MSGLVFDTRVLTWDNRMEDARTHARVLYASLHLVVASVILRNPHNRLQPLLITHKILPQLNIKSMRAL